MSIQLPKFKTQTQIHSEHPLSATRKKNLDSALIVWTKGHTPQQLTGLSLPNPSRIIAAMKQHAASQESGSAQVITTLPHQGRELIIWGVCIKDIPNDAFGWQTAARSWLQPLNQVKAKESAIYVDGLNEADQKALLHALTLAQYLQHDPIHRFKKTKAPGRVLKHLTFLHEQKALPDLKRLQAEVAGNQLVRWLGALPSNHLRPQHYMDYCDELSTRYGWSIRTLKRKQLKALGAEAFLAVCQGSDNREVGIVKCRYQPKGATDKQKPDITLVGKGICFDTGGINLKPHPGMMGMHMDMLGSATALGVLVALTDMNYPYPVEAWLALAENDTDANSYRPNDVVKAINGTHIEVIHTDAEGRMVLADTLSLLAKEKPKRVIDFATLTGACVTAVTERMNGAFTNQPHWHQAIIDAGQDSGERAWPFPLHDDFVEQLDSKIADIRHCRVKSSGDHIYAAHFLHHFIGKQHPWLHIDLSACEHDGGLGAVPTAVTGSGVRFTTSLLLDHLPKQS